MTSSFSSSLAQTLSLGKRLAFLQSEFTDPSFMTLVGIVRSFLKHAKNGTLAQLSQDVGKCISALGYFFTDAKWDATAVKQTMQQQLLHSTLTKPISGDIIAIDESAVSKQGDHFELIGTVWDNAEKKTTKGYELLAAAVVSPSRQLRWLLDFTLSSNTDPKFMSKPLYLKELLQRIFALAPSITTFVFDRGFRYKHILAFILKAKRQFIIRARADMIMIDPQTQKKYTATTLHKMKHSRTYRCTINNQKGWSITWATAVVQAWKTAIPTPLTIVLIQRPSFHRPMMLITSLQPQNVIAAFEIYETYLLRWKIEQIFQSIKELGLEHFRVRSLQAIQRYITIVVLIHNLLVWMLTRIQQLVEVSAVIQRWLKVKRKITNLRIAGLKIFFELYLSKAIPLATLGYQNDEHL